MTFPTPETPPTELRILATGRGWLAIDKPSGVSVHNDPDGRSDAIHLVAERLASDAMLARQTHWSSEQMPSPSHRLDRETSGILLLALNSKTASQLQGAFQADATKVRGTPSEIPRAAKKTYVAVLRGQVSPEAKSKWSWPLSDRAEGRDRPQGPSHLHKQSLTEFRIEKSNRHLTRVICELHTGRQHQIRRHALLAKHAIVGDKRYGEARFNRKIEELYGIQRLLLHATTLELDAGGSVGKICLHCPPPPEFDFIFEDQSS